MVLDLSDTETVFGTQEPTLYHLPQKVTGSHGDAAIQLCEMAGLILDPWQSVYLQHLLSYRRERARNRMHKWAAFEAALIVSRQNGKGAILEARELAGLFLLKENLIIHSAHEFATSIKAFDRLLAWIDNCDDLRKEVKRVSRSHGDEGIELKSGQQINFRTRTKGGGRGFSCDCLVLDEAMILGARQMAALLPTLSAMPNPQVIYTGSAGDQESTQLGSLHARAHICADGSVVCKDPRFLAAIWECVVCNDLCPEDCAEHDDPEDDESALKTNPGIGYRISLEYVQDERRSLLQVHPEEYIRERLGVGDYPLTKDEEWSVIGKDHWFARLDEMSTWDLTKTWVLAIDTTPDLFWSCLAVVGRADGRDNAFHMEITTEDARRGPRLDFRQGVQWVVPRVLGIFEKKPSKTYYPKAVVIDPRGQAAQFIKPLEAEGITVLTPTAGEYATACGEFFSGIVPRRGEDPRLFHLGQEPLNNAVKGVIKRDLADKWAWDKRKSSTIISPLVCGTLGMWGIPQAEALKKSTAWAARR